MTLFIKHCIITAAFLREVNRFRCDNIDMGISWSNMTGHPVPACLEDTFQPSTVPKSPLQYIQSPLPSKVPPLSPSSIISSNPPKNIRLSAQAQTPTHHILPPQSSPLPPQPVTTSPSPQPSQSSTGPHTSSTRSHYDTTPHNHHIPSAHNPSITNFPPPTSPLSPSPLPTPSPPDALSPLPKTPQTSTNRTAHTYLPKLPTSILPRNPSQDLGPAGMLGHEIRHVVHALVDDDVEAFFRRAVRGDFGGGEDLVGGHW